MSRNIRVQMITSVRFTEHNLAHVWGAFDRGDCSIQMVGDIWGGDDYESNVAKMVAGIYLADTDDWSIHMDHDAWVNLGKLQAYAGGLDPEFPAVYGKPINAWPDDPTLTYMSGPCFLMPWITRHKLIRSFVTNSFPPVRWGDVHIGLHLRALGIPVVEMPVPFDHNVTPEQIRAKYATA